MRPRNILYLLALVLLITACDSSQTSSTNASQSGIKGKGYSITCSRTASSGPATVEGQPITLRVTGLSTSSAQDALLTEQVTNFQKLHPDIHVQWSLINGNYSAFIRAAIANGNPPDVFYLQPGMAYDYLSANQLLNLAPYMKRDNVRFEDYYAALINTFSCTTDQVYGVPDGWNTLGIFYNKKKFLAADIAAPSASWTWNDMLATAKKMTWIGEPPEYGVILPANASRWLAFLLANGGSVLTPDGKHATFNSDAGVEALNFYLSFQRQDHSSVLPSDVGPAWNSNISNAFGQQRASMVLEGSWLLPYMQEHFPSVSYDIAPLPLAPNGKRANMIFTDAWAAYNHTQHANAAWTFIKYMTGTEVQRNMLHAGFALPSLPSLATDPYFSEKPAMQELLQAASYGYVDDFGPYDTFIHDRLNLAISSVLFGQADARTALNDAAQQVNKVLGSS